jgi:hypothetical protein
MAEPWAVSQVTAWIRALGPKVSGLGPFELLEIPPTDDMDAIRDAYHAVAATRHPDLFRGRLGEAEAEGLMKVFARVTAAYAKLRDPAERAKYKRRPSGRLVSDPPTPPPASQPPAAGASGTQTPPGLRKINPRALSHVRRAQSMLDVGDVASAVLHLRMAVAADPTAKELRELLTDTEAKLKK